MSEALAKKLSKRFGDIVSVGVPEAGKVTFLPTGIPSYDMILGGGFPRGHISQVWGPDGGGKTLNCIPLVKSAQKLDETVLYIAAEPKVDFDYMLRLGVDPEKIIFMRTNSPDNIMDGNRVMDAVMDAIGLVGLIIVDSVAACIPKVAYDMDSGDTAIGLVAKMLSARLPLAMQKLSPTKTVLLLLNQQRANFGSKYVTTKPFGGYSLRHSLAVNVQMHSMGWVPLRGSPKIGFTPTVKVEKNDFAKPLQTTSWDWYFDNTDENDAGPDVVKDLLMAGKLVGCVNGSAGHYKLMRDGEVVLKIGSTLEESIRNLRTNPELYQVVYEAVVSQPCNIGGEDEEEA